MPTYRDSGVDLDAADRLVGEIAADVRRTWNSDVVSDFGGFAAGIALPGGYVDPVLMLSTDGVGTKADVARRTGLVDGLGYDLVAMCADDLSAAGAKPIAFADYIATGVLDVVAVKRLVRSIAAACQVAGMALLGGETAEHPGVMEPDQFDLSGTALGVVERDLVVDGSEIEVGDRVIGLSSPNLRSNGFSLLRATVLADAVPAGERTGPLPPLTELAMAPSVIYSPVIQDVLATVRPNGLAHITGGGLRSNIARVLPLGTAARIDPRRWTRAAVFDELEVAAGVDRAEMYRTFNMGIGFVVITGPETARSTLDLIAAGGTACWDIGRITDGNRKVVIEGLG